MLMGNQRSRVFHTALAIGRGFRWPMGSIVTFSADAPGGFSLTAAKSSLRRYRRSARPWPDFFWRLATLVDHRRQERKIDAIVGVKFHQNTEEHQRWHNRRSIPRKSIITLPPLITTQQRIIIIRPNITMRAGSMKMPSTTRLRLTSIANKLTNIRPARTLTLKNKVFGKRHEPCRLRSNPGPAF
jgi:hypothetical protein